MENNINKNISKLEFTNSIQNSIEYKEYELIKENYKKNTIVYPFTNSLSIKL